MADRRNRIKEALVAAGDGLRERFFGLSEGRRLDLAAACFLLAEVMPEQLGLDEPEGPQRTRVVALQTIGREILGSLYCAMLTAGQSIGEEEGANLVEYVISMAHLGLRVAESGWPDAAQSIGEEAAQPCGPVAAVHLRERAETASGTFTTCGLFIDSDIESVTDDRTAVTCNTCQATLAHREAVSHG